MKKIGLLFFFALGILNAQFIVKIESPKNFPDNEAYLYSLNGSKDMIMAKSVKQNESWIFNVPNNYVGMMKVYFPITNSTVTFISENKDVNFSFTLNNNKISNVDYKDDANKLFYNLQDKQKKKEQILPALYQIQTYYKNDAPFGEALKKEINFLDSDIAFNPDDHQFIDYYERNYNAYLSNNTAKLQPTNDDIIKFLNTTNNYLEASSLMKPILMVFLSNTSKTNIEDEVDKLMDTINIETPRGQTILSELIDIFVVYNIKDLKEKYLNKAKSLKCTIVDRLSGTIKSNINTSIGELIPNKKFISPTNTKFKSLHEVKADKKIIIFWSSTCPHCEKEMSEMLPKYTLLKSKNIEIVGFSLDTDLKSYSDKVKLLPWINDTELKGWYSDYVDIYNVHATPTFYIVDANNKIISSPDNFTEALDFLGLK